MSNCAFGNLGFLADETCDGCDAVEVLRCDIGIDGAPVTDAPLERLGAPTTGLDAPPIGFDESIFCSRLRNSKYQ